MSFNFLKVHRSIDSTHRRAQFQAGDHVEIVGTLVGTLSPSYQEGTIIRVLPKDGEREWLIEYEVDVAGIRGNYAETQLTLVKASVLRMRVA